MFYYAKAIALYVKKSLSKVCAVLKKSDFGDGPDSSLLSYELCSIAPSPPLRTIKTTTAQEYCFTKLKRKRLKLHNQEYLLSKNNLKNGGHSHNQEFLFQK